MKAKHGVALMATVVVLMTIVAPVRASKTDDQIVSSFKNTYVFKTFLKGDDIQIKSKNGVVTLTGTVSGSIHKKMAQETAENLKGVKSVDNQLTVKEAEPIGNSDADEWIKVKVQMTLSFHRSTNASKTDISVKDGKVTLRGDASSQGQKDLTAEYAKDIDGVKDVDNQMTVSSAKTTAEKVEENIDDSSITVQVKYALMFHRSTSALNTKVETNNGVVTLSGKAKNADAKKMAGKLAEDINGVKSVNNQMTIE